MYFSSPNSGEAIGPKLRKPTKYYTVCKSCLCLCDSSAPPVPLFRKHVKFCKEEVVRVSLPLKKTNSLQGLFLFGPYLATRFLFVRRGKPRIEVLMASLQLDTETPFQIFYRLFPLKVVLRGARFEVLAGGGMAGHTDKWPGSH